MATKCRGCHLVGSLASSRPRGHSTRILPRHHHAAYRDLAAPEPPNGRPSPSKPPRVAAICVMHSLFVVVCGFSTRPAPHAVPRRPSSPLVASPAWPTSATWLLAVHVHITLVGRAPMAKSHRQALLERRCTAANPYSARTIDLWLAGLVSSYKGANPRGPIPSLLHSSELDRPLCEIPGFLPCLHRSPIKRSLFGALVAPV